MSMLSMETSTKQSSVSVSDVRALCHLCFELWLHSIIVMLDWMFQLRDFAGSRSRSMILLVQCIWVERRATDLDWFTMDSQDLEG